MVAGGGGVYVKHLFSSIYFTLDRAIEPKTGDMKNGRLLEPASP
jgi:hypothetical protein